MLWYTLYVSELNSLPERENISRWRRSDFRKTFVSMEIQNRSSHDAYEFQYSNIQHLVIGMQKSADLEPYVLC